MSGNQVPRTAREIDDLIHSRFIASKRKNAKTAPTPYLCDVCPHKPSFADEAAALEHVAAKHATQFSSATPPVEELRKLVIKSSDSKGLVPSANKRQAAPSSEGRGPLEAVATSGISNAISPDAQRIAGPPDRDASGRPPHKLRLLDGHDTPISSIRSSSPYGDRDPPSVTMLNPTATGLAVCEMLSEQPKNDNEQFTRRPQVATKHLFDYSHNSHARRSTTNRNAQNAQKIQAQNNKISREAATSAAPDAMAHDSSQPQEPAIGQRGVFSASALKSRPLSGEKPPIARLNAMLEQQRESYMGPGGQAGGDPFPGSRWEDDSYDIPRMILQPITSAVSQDQLVAEVRGIYAALVMAEGKCIQVDANQAEILKTTNPNTPPQLTNEQYQALIKLHKTLLYEHHSFFLATQHPTAAPGVKRLPTKYAMPARLWKNGMHSLLELLRNRLPGSIEHMLSFICFAYSIMTLLKETIPAFESTWIECLGDLARYRMAIIERDTEHELVPESGVVDDESDTERQLRTKREFAVAEKVSSKSREERFDQMRRRQMIEQERDQWNRVAFEWYMQAMNCSPDSGRLLHHLAILSQANEVQQLFYYGKALTVAQPFEPARESILSLFRPAFGERPWRSGALNVERSYVTMHAILFTRRDIEGFDIELERFKARLAPYIDNMAVLFAEVLGSYMAIANINALLSFGTKSSNPVMQALEADEAGKNTRADQPRSISDQDQAIFQLALRLFNNTAMAIFGTVFSLADSKNVLGFLHCTLIFLIYVAKSSDAIALLQPGFPWASMAAALNYFLQPFTNYPVITATDLPALQGSANGQYIPLREDVAMRELFWAKEIYPTNLFVRSVESLDGQLYREDQFKDNVVKSEKHRPERVLWAAVQLSRHVKVLHYNEGEHRFVAGPVMNMADLAKQFAGRESGRHSSSSPTGSVRATSEETSVPSAASG